MRADHLLEGLREHRLAEVEVEAEMETLGKTSGPEGWERTAKAERATCGGKEREKTKWEKVVEIAQLAF